MLQVKITGNDSRVLSSLSYRVYIDWCPDFWPRGRLAYSRINVVATKALRLSLVISKPQRDCVLIPN